MAWWPFLILIFEMTMLGAMLATRGTDPLIQDMSGVTLTRRAFVKAGGALFVAIHTPAVFTAAEAAETTLDPTRLRSLLQG